VQDLIQAMLAKIGQHVALLELSAGKCSHLHICTHLHIHTDTQTYAHNTDNRAQHCPDAEVLECMCSHA